MIAPPLSSRPGPDQLGFDQLRVQPNRQDVLARTLLSWCLGGRWWPGGRRTGAAEIRTVAARARDDVVVPRLGLRGNPVHLFALAVVACEPLVRLRGNFEGPDAARVVCADGDGHGAWSFPCELTQSSTSDHSFNTNTGLKPDSSRTGLARAPFF
jgi:hypothetical protein